MAIASRPNAKERRAAFPARALRRCGSLPAMFPVASSTPSDESVDVSMAIVVRKTNSPLPAGPRDRDMISTFTSEKPAIRRFEA